MVNENKKAVRARVTNLQDLSNDELLKLWQGPMTRTDVAAIERIMYQRGEKLPEEHGPVTDVDSEPQVVADEDSKEAPAEQEKKKWKVGPLEIVSFILGACVVVFFWPRDPGIAIGYGVGGAMILYVVLGFMRKTFMSLDQAGQKNQNKNGA